MPNPLNLVQSVVGSQGAEIIYGQITKPVPQTFADPLNVIMPDWSSNFPLTFGHWPALYGSVLPAVGSDVLLAVDNRGSSRVVWWASSTSAAFVPTAPAVPKGPAGGALAGNYPNPTLASIVWNALPYNATNWTDFGGLYQVGQYGIDSLGFVHVRGLIKSVAGYSFATPSTMIIATLPAGFRPGAYEMFWGLQLDSITDRSMERIDVSPGGVMTINGGNATALDVLSTGNGNNGVAQYLSLGHITFYQGN